MAGTLAQFTAEIRKRNVSRPNLFYVQLTAPKGDQDVGPPAGTPDVSDDRLVQFLCFGASTPSSNFLTQDNYSTAGTKRKFVYDHDYQNLQLQFYCDQEYQIKKYFDRWKNLILTEKRNFGYPASYTSDTLEVFILNLQDKEVYKYSYKNVFPKSVSEIQLSWMTGNQISTFTVEFTFEEVYYAQIGSTTADIEETSFKNSSLPLPTNPIAKIDSRELLNILQTQSSNDPEVQTIIEAFGGGVPGAILP